MNRLPLIRPEAPLFTLKIYPADVGLEVEIDAKSPDPTVLLLLASAAQAELSRRIFSLLQNQTRKLPGNGQ